MLPGAEGLFCYTGCVLLELTVLNIPSPSLLLAQPQTSLENHWKNLSCGYLLCPFWIFEWCTHLKHARLKKIYIYFFSKSYVLCNLFKIKFLQLCLKVGILLMVVWQGQLCRLTMKWDTLMNVGCFLLRFLEFSSKS